MRRLWFAACALALASGCADDKCAGLSPRAEIAFVLGTSVPASKVVKFRLSLSLNGTTPITKEVDRSAAGFAAGAGRFVLVLDRGEVREGDRLSLEMSALDSAGKALASGKLTGDPVTLKANGCNFFTLQIGSGSPQDGGGGKKDGGGGLVTVQLASQADVEIKGKTANDAVGRVISCKLTSKKYHDLVVAAPNASGPMTGNNKRGRVYLIRGADLNSTPLKLDLSLASSAAVTIIGAADEDRFGSSLACGDLTGNGTDDLVIGAPGADSGRGKVYMFKGGRVYGVTGFDLSVKTNKADLLVVGATAAKAALGAAVAVGRMEQSSFGHLLMGAPGAGPPGRPRAGAVYILPYGSLTGAFSVSLGSMKSNLVVLQGGVKDERLGTALAAGKIDSDGKEGLVAASPGLKSMGTFGALRLLRGQEFTTPRLELDIAKDKHSLTILGPGVDGDFGDGLAVADFTGDGLADIAVGAPAKSRAWVVEGDSGLLTKAPKDRTISIKGGKYKWQFTGPAGAFLGGAIAAVPESIGQSPKWSLLFGVQGQLGTRGGALWLRQQNFGNGVTVDLKRDDRVRVKVMGDKVGDLAGAWVAGGFFNHDDELPDLLLGAPGAAGKAGKVYGIRGKMGW